MNITNSNQFQIHGHRGARGLFPENTITGFIETVKLGIRTLEMDVVISKDLKVVVSHEEWMNEIFCSQPNGDVIENKSREKYNLYKMTYDEIALYDCGSKGNPEFPLQHKIAEHKPLLSNVIKTVDNFTKKNNLTSVIYNIEIKSEPARDTIFNPEPHTFVQLVINELQTLNINNRFFIQSFDIRILKEIKKFKPDIKIGLLVENSESLHTNINRLGFIPYMYNPEFILVTDELIQELHHQNILVIPWTVNKIADMKRLILMGVDGIISDYPNRVIELMKPV